MSFFGFDSSHPPSGRNNNRHGKKNEKPLDFDDTYGGYDEEENDYLNSETFGADVELSLIHI